MTTTSPVNRGLRVSLEETVRLIEESDHDHPLLMGYGNGRLLGPDWALIRVAEYRGIDVGRHSHLPPIVSEDA